MRKKFLFLLVLFVSLRGLSQEIKVNESDLKLKAPVRNNDTTYQVNILVKNKKSPAQTVNIEILDKGTGSADTILDYTITGNTSFTNIRNSTPFSITINANDTSEKEETIVLYFKMTTPDTVVYYKADFIITTAAEPATAEQGSARNKKTQMIKDEKNTNKLEFIQFSDFVGFNNDKPNGLLQQEFRFKWGFAQKWLQYKAHPKLKWQFNRAGILDILFNRLDKSKEEVDYAYPALAPGSSLKDSNSRRLTTMDIWKYSNLHIGFRWVALAVTNEKENFRLHLQTFFKLVRNRPYFADTITSGIDSGKTRSDFRPVYSFAYGVELYAKTSFSDENFVNGDANLGVMWLKLKDSYYRQFDGAVIDPFNRATTLLPVAGISHRKVAPIFYFTGRIYKQWGEDKGNTLFFRINYFYQTGNYYTYLRTDPRVILAKERFHNHFLQLQLGTSIGIENILKPSSGDKKNEKPPIGNGL